MVTLVLLLEMGKCLNFKEGVEMKRKSDKQVFKGYLIGKDTTLGWKDWHGNVKFAPLQVNIFRNKKECLRDFVSNCPPPRIFKPALNKVKITIEVI